MPVLSSITSPEHHRELSNQAGSVWIFVNVWFNESTSVYGVTRENGGLCWEATVTVTIVQSKGVARSGGKKKTRLGIARIGA
jgi:hypothetical protein